MSQKLTWYDTGALSLLLIASIAFVYVTAFNIQSALGPSVTGSVVGIITGIGGWYLASHAYLWVRGYDELSRFASYNERPGGDE